MRFIDQYEIALLHVIHTLVDGLNTGKENLRADFALF